MENLTIMIICILIILMLSFYYLIKRQNKIDRKHIYVYPKSKNKYYIKGEVKMKNVEFLCWEDAILYFSLKNGQYYVMEKTSFFKKFIPLTKWEEQNGNIK